MIIDEAKQQKLSDNSLSNTIEFELIEGTETWLGNDRLSATLKSCYQECFGQKLFIRRKR
jgi:hypothetical protein